MITTTYPGVYISEESSQSLSIASGATAVPVFAATKADMPVAEETDPVRVSDWLSFTRLYGDISGELTVFQATVRAYFENGGSYCYLAPIGGDDSENAEAATYAAKVDAVDEITLVVGAGHALQTTVLNTLCGTGKTRFAILDYPRGAEVTPDVVGAFEQSPYIAYYYPWLKADWLSSEIPPSGAVAGIYCKVDREVGPWKSPANISVSGGYRPQYSVTDDIQSQYMEPPALNMLRELSGMGLVVWGARTSASEADSQWRYVPVRRLFCTVEHDLKRALAFSVFEPNSQPTWERVRSAINSYLNSLWKNGGLMGNTPEEAYFIQVGLGVTMTESDIDQGKMIVKIGMAAARPAEFIILEFTQNMQTA